jgi:hypothetical protein
MRVKKAKSWSNAEMKEKDIARWENEGGAWASGSKSAGKQRQHARMKPVLGSVTGEADKNGIVSEDETNARARSAKQTSRKRVS